MSTTFPHSTPDIALVEEGLYSVLSEVDTLGYVHKVHNVYVALRGSDLSHAIEIGQTLSFDRAIDLVRSH
jgi:hypothetical protein